MMSALKRHVILILLALLPAVGAAATPEGG